MKINGNTILITGGSSGIGLAFARKFVDLGNDVIITGRNKEKLKTATDAEPRLKAFQCDASKPSEIVKLSKDLKQSHPKLNVLMNNAGVLEFRNLSNPEDNLEQLTNEVTINLDGPIRTVAAFVEQLKINRGTIINVSSGLAYVPLHSAPIYSATKAAIHSYTVSLRLQLKEHNVSVIELMPPGVRTEMTGPMHSDSGVKLISTEDLVKYTIAELKKGEKEIRPGQSNQLHWMSRIAPNFIQGELAKQSKKFIPME